MKLDQPDYGLISDAAFLVEGGRIAWVGPAHQAPSGLKGIQAQSLEGRLVTPALIDCHTHLVFGGNRASEFEMRQNGATYEQISNRGGGIKSTVAATRAASFDELVTTALRRLDCLIREGVAVVEVKSGYGLTIEDEIRLLRVARHLEQLRPVKIMTTWLAAHAVPADYLGRPDAYIDEVAIPGLEQAAQEKLVDAVDGFCETIAFTPAQIDRVFQAARALDLPVKLHAEQLTDQGGARLAAGYSALSADHLEFLPESDAAVLAASGTVAVLLPGAFYTLKETKTPPVEAFRAAGVDMAVATDCNPGTSPLSSLLTAMNLACIQFSLTPEEALAGTTRHAAKALGLSGDYGEITEGALAELAVWNVEHPAELSYWVGGNPLYQRIMQQD
ncbi:MAG: imidazolonepropionase [Alphaproteobacteria bacterium]|nr:imidazolonepropionase [Alphaproteobacteria bacterium]